MSLKPHPISLERLFFTRSVVISISEHADVEQKKTALITPENHIDITQIEDDPGAYIVTMRSLINKDENPAYPYMVDMECQALLRADLSLSEAEAKKGITITGHSVVYGAIRESISWITGRHPYGQLVLGLSVLTPREKPSEE